METSALQENAELRQQQAAAEEKSRKADMRQLADQHKQVKKSACQTRHTTSTQHCAAMTKQHMHLAALVSNMCKHSVNVLSNNWANHSEAQRFLE